VVVEKVEIGHWILTHEPMERRDIPLGKINMAGHLHPGARLEGKGRQGITLPCFWFAPNQLILPAFGSFTGLATIRPSEQDHVYIIIENKVMEISLTAPRKSAKLVR
jgi:metallophosphoesterase superfamily enzyme